LLLPIGALCLVLYIELGFIARNGPLPADISVAIWFRAHRVRSLVQVAKVIGALTAPVIVFAVGVIILLFLNYWTRSWYLRDFLPLALLSAAALISIISKWYFDRTRPSVPLAAYFDFTTSYPSAHAIFSAAAGGALLLYATKRKFLIFLAVSVITSFIGIVQLTLGIHWISDIAGSTLLSWGLLIVFYVIDDWLAEREAQSL
jgi:membrane-associated phospholipid phosphatase